MAAFKNKGTPKLQGQTGFRQSLEEDVSPKPLSTAIMQELANLKEKFKNEDDEDVKGKLLALSIYLCGFSAQRQHIPFDRICSFF